jgi:hypothetical protein
MDTVNEFNAKQPKGQKTGFCIGPSHQIQANQMLTLFETWIKNYP